MAKGNIASKPAEMRSQRAEKKAQTEEEAKINQLIVFNLGDEEFGAEIGQVREIIRAGTITPIPDSPQFIKGVSNVRGEITVVIDLKERFFLPAKREGEGKHIIITEQKKNLFGLMVDEVTEVLRIPETDIKPTPELVTRIDRVYISGVLTLEGRLIMLLDLTKVLSDEELARLTEISRRHHTAAQKEEQPAEVETTEPKDEKEEQAEKITEESM